MPEISKPGQQVLFVTLSPACLNPEALDFSVLRCLLFAELPPVSFNNLFFPTMSPCHLCERVSTSPFPFPGFRASLHPEDRVPSCQLPPSAYETSPRLPLARALLGELWVAQGLSSFADKDAV